MSRTIFAACIIGCLALATIAWSAPDDGAAFRGTWGMEPQQIGMKPAAPDMLPQGPFMGPGGFRIDTDGTLWVTDSVQGCVKGFPSPASVKAGAKVTVFPCGFSRLGDLAVTPEEIYVVSMNPAGLQVLSKDRGTLKRFIPVDLKNPGRLLVISPDRQAIEDGTAGLWLIKAGAATRHPAPALEAIGTADSLFGTLYDFEPGSRKILKAGWDGPGDEPDLFAIVRKPGQTIAFSRLAGLIDDTPVLVTVTASAPQILDFTHLDGQGRVRGQMQTTIQGSVPLPSQWTIGADGVIYCFNADLRGFVVTTHKMSGRK